MSKKAREFTVAFSDAWAALGMISTAIALYFFLVRVGDFQVGGLVGKIYEVYSSISRFVFDALFYFFPMQVSQLTKDALLLYLLIGATVARAIFVFKKLSMKDAAKGLAAVYGSKGNQFFVRLVLPDSGTLYAVLAGLVGLLAWPLLLNTGVSYFAISGDGEGTGGDGGLDLASHVDLRSIFWMQLAAITSASLIFVILS